MSRPVERPDSYAAAWAGAVFTLTGRSRFPGAGERIERRRAAGASEAPPRPFAAARSEVRPSTALDSLARSVQGLLMSLNMLIEFGEAFDYTGADFRAWCGEAGFKKFEVIHLAGPSSAAVAWK